VRCYARVPEYDAFGREIGEDPLAAFRAPVPVPVPAPAPPEPEPVVAEPAPVVVPPPPQIARPQRRRRRGGVARLLVLVAIVAGIGLATNSAVEKGGDIIESITPEESAPAPTGLQADSLLRRDNFAAAVKTLQGADLGRPVSIRVAPDRINATLLKGHTFHLVQISPDGDLNELGRSEAATRAAAAYRAIDVAAPEKLVRAGATRKQPARSIGYVVLFPGPPVTWGAYYKRGRIVIGDRHGRLQRVL
jgi:hypothetical protein